MQRKIDAVTANRKTDFRSIVNVPIHTTYLGREPGVMVFKDSLTGQILNKQYVQKETSKLYLQGIEAFAQTYLGCLMV